jgi:Domain of unknown function (DUF4411)
MAYLIDSNCFIEASNRWYGPDFCPGFWSWLDRENSFGHLFSIDKVKAELLEGDDELKAWAQQKDDAFFLPVDADALACYGQITAWLDSSASFAVQHITSFLSKADPWLIGYAKAHGHTVVTHEKLVDPAPRKSRYLMCANSLR